MGPPVSAAHPSIRRLSPYSEQLVFERTVAHDDARGVYILRAAKRPKPPTLEQIEVWRRIEEQRHNPRPIVTEIRETLLQRLARIRRRLEARRRAAQAVSARLEGISA